MTSVETLIRAAFRESDAAQKRSVACQERAPERRAAGRYTIDEATRLIRESAGHDVASGIGSALSRAVTAGSIPTYAPGSMVKHEQRGSAAGADWLELYGDDLNVWLEQAAPRLDFRFPSSVAASNDSGDESQEQRQGRRYQLCVDAGMKMPTSEWARLPNGINKLAKEEGITQQAFSKDVKAHITRLAEAAKTVPQQ